MSLAADIAQALGQRETVIPAPHVNKNGRSSEPQHNVKRAVDIYLPLDGTGDHFAGARYWGHARNSDSPDPRFYFFQVMCLMMEVHSFGSVRPKASIDTEPRSYWFAVATTVFQIYDPKASRANTLKELVIADNMFDETYHAHVKASSELYSEFMKLAKAPVPRKKKGDDLNSLIELVNVASNVQLMDWSVYDKVRMTVLPDSSPVMEGLQQCENAWFSIVQSKKSMAAAAKKPADGSKPSPTVGDFANYLMSKHTPVEGETNQVHPKVTFTSTTIYNDDHSKVCGMYVRFLIRDPDSNPGKFYEKLMDNLAKRNKRKAQKSQRSFDTTEMFPAYKRFYNTLHPAGDHTRLDTYVNCAKRLNPALFIGQESKTYKELSLADFKNPIHIYNLFTPQQAMLDMSNQEDSSILCRATIWWDEQTKTASYPPANVAPTFVYHPDAIYWYSEQYIGLSYQMFPHIDSKNDLIAAIVAGDNLDRFVDENDVLERHERKYRTIFDERDEFIENNWNIPRSIIDSTTFVPYRTYNAYVHQAYLFELVKRRIDSEFPSHAEITLKQIQALGVKWRQASFEDVYATRVDEKIMALQFGEMPYSEMLRHIGADESIQTRAKQYERYAKLCQESQRACNETFINLWQTEGNIDSLPVPDTIKTILKWYEQHRNRLPHMTRQFVMYDPQLGIFGNSTIKMIDMYATMGRLLQPMIAVLVEGLCSAYRWSPKQLAFNIILYGGMGNGKSMHTITVPQELNFIPGSITTYTSETAAASTTQKQVYDEIQMRDETPEALVNPEVAKKFPDFVNQEKVKLTARQVSKKVFVNAQGDDGEAIRLARIIHSDHYSSMLTITNAELSAQNPYSTRLHRMTMAKSDTTAAKLTGPLDKKAYSDAQMNLHIGHFLMVAVWKCIQCGGMYEPNMQLFSDISGVVIDILEAERAISRDFIERRLEIMMAYALVCVVRFAIHCCYDMPGGENYEQPFDASQVRNVQRYMYCTTEIIVWTWTALVSNFIEEKNSIMLCAAMKSAGLMDWPDDGDTYYYYERDLKNSIPWRLQDNPDFKAIRGVESNGDEKLVNINYITLEGTLDQIAGQIAAQTNYRLNVSDIRGIINQLKTHRVELAHGGYRPQPRASFAAWHKFTDVANGVKNSDSGMSNMPPEYRMRTGEGITPRTRDDVPCFERGTGMMAIDDCDLATHHRLYIMPFIANMFRSQIVIDALRVAITCKTTSVGKYLVGIPSSGISTQLKVMQLSQEEIDEHVRRGDLINHWDENGDWTGDKDIPMQERSIPLSVGIGIERRGIVSSSSSIFYTMVPNVPTLEKDKETWKADAVRSMSKMKVLRTIYDDLDVQSALQQHVRIGLPLTQTIATPKQIVSRMETYCKAYKLPFQGDLDYPHSSMADYYDNRAVWRGTQSSMRGSLEAYRQLQSKFSAPAAREASVATRIQKRNREERDESDKISLTVRVPALAPPAPTARPQRAEKPSKPRGRPKKARGPTEELPRALQELDKF